MNDDRLNPQQKKAVEATEGPLLIFAGAGSGKTLVIIHRIARLLDAGISPFNILAVTFTNKAAQEMRDRIKQLAGSRGTSVWISTFHAFASRILRYDREKAFTIYDEHDQVVAIKQALTKLGHDPKKVKPSMVKEIIQNAKNNLLDPESFIISAGARSDKLRMSMGEVYREYQRILEQNGGLDFADLIGETIKLFKENPDILEKYRERFRYIMVDEYQDTNYAQYVLVKMLAPPQNNICVVGDDDQCLAEGTLIQSPDKRVPIESIRRGSPVITGSGWGKTASGKCGRPAKRKYAGQVVRIKTAGGRELLATPNHIMFARLAPADNLFYVYLMYKKDMGYRIGVTKGIRSKRKSDDTVNGLKVRLNQEAADKLWILKACPAREEALFFEMQYAYEYGIPTYIFHCRGRKMALGQEKINELYRNIDTAGRASALMAELNLDPAYPHISAAGYVSADIKRKIMNFTMFGENRCCESRPWHAHRIQLNSSDRLLEKKVSDLGFNVRKGRKNTWKVETSRKDYSEAAEFLKGLCLAGIDEIDIVKKARLAEGKSFCFMPAGQVHPGMVLPVLENGVITEDTVEEAALEDYDGYVYDFSVPDFKNYVAGGIVVHNSVYSWRGADIRNILEFEKNFKCSSTLKLEQNYRSTQCILAAAHNVIKNNISRKDKKLWTENECGEKVKWQEFITNREEAKGVISEIRRLVDEGYRPGDVAIFYRVNAQSRSFEDVLRAAGINYRIIGGVRFYERKEIKDVLAYMRIIVNPEDDISMARIINCPPRGLGNKSISGLRETAAKESKSLYSLIRDGSSLIPPAVEKKIKALRDLFSRLEETYRADDASRLAKEVIELSGYHRMLEGDDDITARSRLENIEELVSAFAEEENAERSIKDILSEISLLTDLDKMEDTSEYVTLMTVHLAKGLEFPAVFLTGLEEELFPHRDALMDPAQMEEERRLCYVGMTRARQLLYLTSASQRMLYGQSRWHIPSRFIRESLGDKGGEREYVYD